VTVKETPGKETLGIDTPVAASWTKWDHLRGVVIALVLVAHGVYALPLPPALTEKRVSEPSFQEDIDIWMRLVHALHVPLDRQQVERIALDGSRALHTLHTTLKAPFAPVMSLVGANQSWALFASTSTKTDRLEVSIQRGADAEWEVLLRRLDPCCTWRESMLEYRRIRGVWDGQRDVARPGYKGLAKWLAACMFDEFPDATAVRVRLVREHVPLPGEPVDHEVSFKHERVHRRKSAP
jgi:hypothetical protein